MRISCAIPCGIRQRRCMDKRKKETSTYPDFFRSVLQKPASLPLMTAKPPPFLQRRWRRMMSYSLHRSAMMEHSSDNQQNEHVNKQKKYVDSKGDLCGRTWSEKTVWMKTVVRRYDLGRRPFPSNNPVHPADAGTRLRLGSASPAPAWPAAWACSAFEIAISIGGRQNRFSPGTLGPCPGAIVRGTAISV